MGYSLGIDIGGTFTDLLLFEEETAKIFISKVPSTPEDFIIGLLRGIENLKLKPENVDYFVHGTTIATNTVLERKGAKLALITTKGFEDVLEIQWISREFHYDLQWTKPRPLIPRTLRNGVEERTDYRGRILKDLNKEEAVKIVKDLIRSGVESIAVCFLHSYANPENEINMKNLIKSEAPEVFASFSHEILSEFREYERTSTTVMDAYVKPIVNTYLSRLEEEIRKRMFRIDICIMRSNGGVMTTSDAREKPVNTILSGPVGGAFAAKYICECTSYQNVISFDMGGTSTDVTLIRDGTPEHTTERELEWGIPIKIPMVDIRTVGAGGGSIAWIDRGGLLKVGPNSAGAAPGPACYGQGGKEPTVTDANLVLGYLNASYFAGGDIPLILQDATKAIEENIAKSLDMNLYEAAQGIVDISSHNITQLINEISTEQGYDPREFALVAFGGAGPVQAGIVAEALGIRTIIIPVYPGVLSALGMLLVDPRYDFVQSCLMPLEAIDLQKVNTIFESMKERGINSLKRAGHKKEFRIENFMDVRFYKQNFEVITPIPNLLLEEKHIQTISQNFCNEYEKLYGHIDHSEPIEIVNLRTSVSHPRERQIGRIAPPKKQKDLKAALKGRRKAYFRETEGFVNCPVYDRDSIPNGVDLPSPAIIEELGATTIVYPNQYARLDAMGNITITLS